MKDRQTGCAVAETVAYIEEKLAQGEDESLALDEIAGRIGYSKYHLGRLFRRETGSTIHQYIVERRLAEAAKSLAGTDKPIADIAWEAGYQSQQAFTDAFSRVYAIAPGQYRLAGTRAQLRGKRGAAGTLYLAVWSARGGMAA